MGKWRDLGLGGKHREAVQAELELKFTVGVDEVGASRVPLFLAKEGRQRDAKLQEQGGFHLVLRGLQRRLDLRTDSVELYYSPAVKHPSHVLCIIISNRV